MPKLHAFHGRPGYRSKLKNATDLVSKDDEISAADNRKPKSQSCEMRSRNFQEKISREITPRRNPYISGNDNKSCGDAVKYRECRKNHAARTGGYSVDGCREFIAGGEEGTSAAFRCAACSCHRNFHKREEEEERLSDCSSISNANTR